MHIKHHYTYLLAPLLLICCIALCNCACATFSFPFQHNNQIAATTTHARVLACPCPHAGAGTTAKDRPYCPCPTPTSLPHLNMNSATHLLIPAIGVNAPIEPVGLLSNGALNVPQKNPWTGVGWYKDGPIPGQLGSAIIDGHLDRPRGAPAVFWNLNQLHRGDVVTIVDAQGQALHFRVLHLQAYQPDKAPLDKIYGDISGRYLNLITCAGSWIPSQHQTTERLVVFSILF
jgi:sortase (surface protein transpeptidase)